MLRQGINREVDETNNQINDWENKEEKDIRLEQLEKRIQKIEDSVSSLWDKLKGSNICIIGEPEEEKDQQIGNLLEKILKENFLNLVKEIDMQLQEAQRVPKKLDPKRTT